MKTIRFLFSRFLLICLLLLINSCSSSGEGEKLDTPHQPNILFISVDDMNDWTGYLDGHPGMEIHTPNIDRLAASSLVFTNAYAPSPACAPSRTAVMTGVHPARSGIMHNIRGDGPVWREYDALQNVETLEQFFKNSGYITLGGGKIYHSQAPPWTTSSQVEPENWDFYFPSPYLTHPYQIRSLDDVIYPEGVDNENRPGGMPGWWTWGPIDTDDEKMADYHVVEWAANELSRKHEKPFFLAVGTWKPHDPWEVPRKYFDMYPLEKIMLPEITKNDLQDAFDHGRRNIHKWVLQNDQSKKIIQAYAASITFADAMIGRLLKALENSVYADNTIVVFWSDHGMHMGEKENWEKFTLWERATRVPFMIKASGVTESGSKNDQPVSLLDIYPTLAELAGFEIPDHVDGTSLVPLIEDSDFRHAPVITSYRFRYRKAWHIGPLLETQTGHAVRSGQYRYIYYPSIRLEELYDHRSDPNEWENIAYKKGNEELVKRHRQILRKLLPELTWEESGPVGYQVTDGKIQRKDFIPISDQN